MVSRTRGGTRHLAEPRQQHDHGADAREHQHEGRGERRQEGDVDLHATALLTGVSHRR